MPEIILTISGQKHRGWKSVSITRSIERVCSGFELTLTDNWRTGQTRTIKTGELCTIHLDNELLVTGYTDQVAPSYDEKSHTISVSGRSKTADLVDCSGKNIPFANSKLDAIAKKLCEQFGITVVVDADVGKPFKSVDIERGQPIFEFLEYLARIRAVRLVTNAQGNLVVTNAGTTYTAMGLEFGKNIRAARGAYDLSQTFSNYLVCGQQGAGGETFVNTSNVEPYGEATDARVKRYRSLVMDTDGPVDIAGAKTRAEWECNTRFGRSRMVTYTVSGWQQTPGGKTWVPNQLVQIKDPWVGIDGPRLIVDTRMTLDENGSATEITVMPKEAFDLVPLPEPESNSGGWE